MLEPGGIREAVRRDRGLEGQRLDEVFRVVECVLEREGPRLLVEGAVDHPERVETSRIEAAVVHGRFSVPGAGSDRMTRSGWRVGEGDR